MEHGGGFLHALDQSALGMAMKTWIWLYPSVNTAHLLGIGLLFGSIVVWDLRLLGLSRQIPVSRLARHLLPFTLLGFVVAALSGLGLFITEPDHVWTNVMFRAKLALIVLAGINAAVFHLGVYKGVGRWDVNTAPPPQARLAGGLSLAIWTLAIVCGRFIAYV